MFEIRNVADCNENVSQTGFSIDWQSKAVSLAVHEKSCNYDFYVFSYNCAERLKMSEDL